MPRIAVAVLLLFAAACASPSSGPRQGAGRSTSDERVKSYQGKVPQDVFTDGTWVSQAGATSLAALRGRVVYVQFAFPQ